MKPIITLINILMAICLVPVVIFATTIAMLLIVPVRSYEIWKEFVYQMKS